LSSQVSELKDVELEAWINFLRAHAAVTRQFNAELQATHGLTINDFDVLASLSRAPERALKRVDLVERVLLTPSGITRLLKGLEEAGYVANRACEEDARVTYAVLTDDGAEKLRAARKTHRESVRALFSERFEKEELTTLASLLERLPMRDLPCE
jgi:DNA-binding MarR family transcriptional regulator